MTTKSLKSLFALLGCLMACCATTLGQSRPLLDVPYVQSSSTIVYHMLKLAKVKSGDVLYDLGCGDGRIVIAAVSDFGATGIGFDLDPQRIAEAKASAARLGLSEKATFRIADLFDVDLSEATVIAIYLLPTVNMQLRPKLLALKPGTRIVSNAFGMGDWQPDRMEKVDGSTIYLWTVPENKSL
jgi:SAM-dependent methyltransferase